MSLSVKRQPAKITCRQTLATGLLCLLFTAVFAACAFRKEKGEDDDGIALLPFAERASLSFDSVTDQVLRRCMGCHGSDGGVRLETYADVIARLADIERVVFRTKTMPKGAPLTMRQLSVLKTWIVMGAPQVASVTPPDTLPPDPIEPPDDRGHAYRRA